MDNSHTSPGEYSFLLSNIQNRIGAGAGGSGKQNSSEDGGPSTTKRLRMSPVSPSSSSPTFSPTIGIGMYSSGRGLDNTRIAAEMDELKLQNEHLKDQATRLQDELDRAKERTTRQVSFLEQENAKLKKLAEDRAEKYYEEKKKWQARLRAAEASLAASTSANPSSTSSSSSSSSSHQPSTSNASDSTASEREWNARLLTAEKTILSKSNEVKTLATLNANLEERVKTLEQDLLRVRSNVEATGVKAEEAAEARDLRKRLADAESQLKRKTRELEKLVQKLHNQSLLEEELAHTQTKLKLAQNAAEAAHTLEATCQSLMNEKATWTNMFRGMIQEDAAEGSGGGNSNSSSSSSSSSSSGSSGDVTPMAVLRMLSSTQKRCAVLLKTQGDLEGTIADQRRSLSKAEARVKELESSLAESAFESERFEHRLRLAQQQAKLFEGEVTSLRALLTTFDAECKFGRPEVSDMMKMKDDVIQNLRSEIDQCRSQAANLASNIGNKEAHTSIASKQLAEDFEELKQKHESLKLHYLELQHVTKTDFIPSQTKILHMCDNPAAWLLGARSKPEVSTVPTEQLRFMRAEVKRLQRLDSHGGEAGDRQLQQQFNPLNSTQALTSVNTSLIGSSNNGALCARCGGSSGGGGSGGGGGGLSADASILNKRLKETFKERIALYKEGVYLLFGYKMDLFPAEGAGCPRLRLRSMYADDPDDSLLFQWRGDKLELLDTNFVSKMDQRLLAYLNSCHSVPAFLSNVTIDLFDAQTFAAPPILR